MVYAASNPPDKLSQGLTGGRTLWVYVSADAHGTVDDTDYFTNGDALGMKVNDVVLVISTGSSLATIHAVSAVTAGGAATVSSAVLS
jgi:hypothetical protein